MGEWEPVMGGPEGGREGEGEGGREVFPMGHPLLPSLHSSLN